MSKKLVLIILTGIVILGGALRLWQLGDVPPSPDWDEAALGYDAYSILHTGRDQFGKFLPVVLRSLNDYKPALYAYLAIPSIAIFDLNVFAVRFPSAIFGILSIIAVFYLVKETFENYKYKDYLSLISSFLLAISPWSIQFSRIGFESNVGTAFNIFAALFFLKGLKKPWLLSLSAICAGLAVYTYQSEKVFTPLLLLLMIILFWKKLITINKKYLISSIIVGLIIVLPMIFYTVTDKSSLERLRGTSVFSAQTELLKANLRKLDRDQQNNDKLGLLLDNRRVVYAKTILQNYLTHFDLNWLFIKGDIARHHAHGIGIMYLFELPLLLLGIYSLIVSEKFEKRTKLFVFLWLFMAPIPASVTTGVPSAVRTLNFLPAVQILTAIGIMSFAVWTSKFKQKVISYLILSLFFVFCLFNIFYYLNQYFVQSSYYDSAYWQYGYKQAVNESVKLQDKYKKIIVANDESMSQSYIFFLFYLKYFPEDYQRVVSGKQLGTENISFGKYVFREIDWSKDFQSKDTLYIGSPNEFSNDASVIETIYNLDGTPAMKIVGT